RASACELGVCVRAFLQWLIFPDGSFVSEVSSSLSLDPSHALTEGQEGQLLALGWTPPRPPGAPNYFRVSLYPAEVPEAARMALVTLEEVFGVGADEVVLVKMTESRSRYSTPLEEATGERAGTAAAPSVG